MNGTLRKDIVKAKCPVCGTIVRVRNDGRIAVHGIFTGPFANKEWKPCTGSQPRPK